MSRKPYFALVAEFISPPPKSVHFQFYRGSSYPKKCTSVLTQLVSRIAALDYTVPPQSQLGERLGVQILGEDLELASPVAILQSAHPFFGEGGGGW